MIRCRFAIALAIVTLASGPLTARPADDAAPAPPTKPAPAAAPAATPPENPSAAQVHIDFDEPPVQPADKESDELLYAPPIEQLLRDPAIAANIANGAEALNKSVDSLFDALFYSLLTVERNVDLTPDIWINSTLRRTVFSAPTGSYVIVDRFLLGPRYSKTLWTIQNVPVSLGIDGSVEAAQIYLRNDGMRLAAHDALPAWRRTVNNWFGLVPLLGQILPPSFNQNYMYDPVTEVETPFVFPLDEAGFNDMPVGSIRSYAVSGGVRLSPDLAGLLDQDAQAFLARVGGVQAGMPYAIFKRGEHRINVLRRGEHNAWVGVADLNRTGHGVNPLVGQQYYILTGALAANVFKYHWMWKGVPITVLPISFNIEQALAKLFDQVYEFDLTKASAREAYEAAVRGDFLPAHGRYLDAKEKGLDTGVAFHFARNQDRTETIERAGPNIAVYRREREREHDLAEIEITDPEGKFYVLESQLNIDDKRWNILVGEDEERYQQTLEMRVRRIVNKANPNDASDYTYAFEPGPDPYRLTMGLNIQDRYVDVVSYQRYIAQLRSFTDLALDDAPSLPTREPEAEVAWRRGGYFTEPTTTVNLVHVMPTYLGKFGAQASVSLSATQLDAILATNEDFMWAAFAKAYGVDPSWWGDPVARASLPFQAQWFKALFAYPLRLFNVHVPAADAVAEAANGVAQLLALRKLEAPLDKLHGFYELLNSDHPRELARALLDLTDIRAVPRRVTFSAQPAGSGREALKAAYGKLNNRTFHGGPPFPLPSRYMRAKSTLAKFSLDQPRVADERPRLARIQVTAREVPASVRALPQNEDDDGEPINRVTRHVFITFSAHDVIAGMPLRVYVKVEQAGRVKLGKLDLAEQVLDLPPIETTPGPGNTLSYEFYLTGPLSPLSGYMLDEVAQEGDELQVTMAVSRDGAVWSDERTMQFRYDRGMLLPMEP